MSDLSRAWERVEAWVSASAPELLRASPPATAPRIAGLARALRRELPPELAAWLAIHDGVKMAVLGPPAETPWTLFGASRVEEEWKRLADLHTELEAEHGRLPHRVIGPISPVFWKDSWIPIASNGAGDTLCIDTAPDGGGAVGQIVMISRDAAPHELVAASLALVIERFADGLERGDYEVEPFVGIVPRSRR